jgi:histidine triad (HIT) family protein
MNCLFCKIVAGEIPAQIVERNDLVTAFNDITPQAPTHVLIIPNQHFENIGAVALSDQKLVGAMFAMADQIAKSKQLDGYRTVLNTGASVGQSVFHAHLHLLAGRAFAWPPG